MFSDYDAWKLESPREYSEQEMEAADLIRCARCRAWVEMHDVDENGDCPDCTAALAGPIVSETPKAKE